MTIGELSTEYTQFNDFTTNKSRMLIMLLYIPRAFLTIVIQASLLSNGHLKEARL